LSVVRIKVIKASHLALGAAVVILALVLISFILQFALADREKPVMLQFGETTAGITGEAADIAAFSVARNAPIEITFPGDTIDEDEHTDEIVPSMEVEVIRPQEQPSENPLIGPENAPRILIYHTHTHEAYEQVSDDPYVEVSQWRTADQLHSVVRVGEALAELLTQRGFIVVHDCTDHEPPKLNTAYARSLATLESYDEPFDLYIDLHRDAYSAGRTLSAAIGEERAAQLMILLGKGDGFREKPDYQSNLRFATALEEAINELAPGLCRGVMTKTNRYNQHIGSPAMIVEVGHNKNSLEEALNAMPYLADAIGILLARGAADVYN